MGGRIMQYDEIKYNSDVNAWFAALKDIPPNDLLRQHINRYPEKKDYEIPDEQKEDNEPKT